MSSQEKRNGSRTTLLIAAAATIVVVIVVVAYFVSLSFAPKPGGYIPSVMYSDESVEGGWRITIMGITNVVYWDEIRIHLEDGSSFADWDTRTSDLDDGFGQTVPYGTRTLGGLAVTLTVTDTGGNGVASGSDYFVLTAGPAFSSTITYSAALFYKPAGALMGIPVTFTG